jgi:hypothetical protein
MTGAIQKINVKPQGADLNVQYPRESPLWNIGPLPILGSIFC